MITWRITRPWTGRSLRQLRKALPNSGTNSAGDKSAEPARLFVKGVAGLAVLALLGACSASPDPVHRPDSLAKIKPTHGPVKRASLRASSKVMRDGPPHRRPRVLASLPKPLTAEVVTPKRRLQCVPYARELSNIQIRGDAWTWWGQAEGRYARSSAPKAGSVLVLQRKKDGGSLGHVAYVEDVIDSRTITVSHSNWLNEGRLHKHTPVRDVSEANDWSEVRFWHTPGGHFGGSVYHPYGFILPNANMTVASR